MRHNSEQIQKLITTEAGRRALEYISPIYDNARIGLMILNTIGIELQDIDDWTQDIWKQAYPQTATWALPYWEEEFGITPDETRPSKDRRSQLISTIQTKAPMNPAKVTKIIAAVAGCDSRIEENVSKNKFVVWLLAQSSNETKLRETIDRIKPTHTIYDIQYEQVIAGLCSVGMMMNTYKNFTVRQGN